jgi:hypothetical protein
VPVADRATLVRYSSSGEHKGMLGEAGALWRNNGYVLAFSPSMYATVFRDTIYVAEGYENAYSVIDARGTVVRKVQAPPVKDYPADVVWSALEAKLNDGNKTLYLQYLKNDRVPRQKQFPKVGGLLVDDAGLIWLKAYDPFSDALWLKSGNADWPAPGGEWRVLQRDGKLLATAQMPAGVRPLVIKGNRLLGVATDELGVQYVVVYAIQRK